ncbi:MAG: thiamine pyrophosphate-binding protein [Alphaproteobacteria bacterium]|nr:thiamine pyrophosphate-binding protein [Alphaproteobacteria bacterium]
MESSAAETVAGRIAQFLKVRGIDRVFGLCGGHVMPIWDQVARAGIRIVDVRDERAGVHMAHAHAELTGGIGVAFATAGPGVTNAITGIVNAHVARAPVVILSGVPPRPQEQMGALQDLVHTDLLHSVTRQARTVREADHVLPALDEAFARAIGDGGLPGPVYLDFPTDLLREALPGQRILDEHLEAKAKPALPPAPEAVQRAVDILWNAKRPLVVSGRGAREAGPELLALLDALDAVYLDTSESRGLVPDSHASVVSSLRGQVMEEADAVLTVGRRLDFQLAYGSPAIFKKATFVRLAEHASELRDNRRGAAEILASPALALDAIVKAAGNRKPATDRIWLETTREKHAAKREKFRALLASAPPGSDGYMHPNRLLSALQEKIAPDAVTIADGGDILSFARVALSAGPYMDPGSLGCLGVGVPFGIAAALALPDRQVVVITGDGSFGFNAIEVDTAVRHGAKVVFVVANNGAWNIECYDQRVTYDGNLVGTELRHSDYATLGRALGAHGERVEKPEELEDALARCFEKAPAVLDVLVTREAVSGDGKSGLAWVPDTQPLAAWDEAERARWAKPKD